MIYIIKENRTYDQILGDLAQGRKASRQWRSKPDDVRRRHTTPNLHKLALQFGVLDNFYDSGEVSGDGHVWSNAAIGTDYLEKTWQQAYRGGQRSYDFEGVVAEGLPLLQKIPDVNEPASGYLWGNLAAHGKTYYHFGEFISTVFCDEKKTANPQQGPVLPGTGMRAQGDRAGRTAAGGVGRWREQVAVADSADLASNTATKPELVGHFAAEAPDFNLAVPDQIRVEIFLRHLKEWEADKKQGKDTMPNFMHAAPAGRSHRGNHAGQADTEGVCCG